MVFRVCINNSTIFDNKCTIHTKVQCKLTIQLVFFKGVWLLTHYGMI